MLSRNLLQWFDFISIHDFQKFYVIMWSGLCLNVFFDDVIFSTISDKLLYLDVFIVIFKFEMSLKKWCWF